MSKVLFSRERRIIPKVNFGLLKAGLINPLIILHLYKGKYIVIKNFNVKELYLSFKYLEKVLAKQQNKLH